MLDVMEDDVTVTSVKGVMQILQIHHVSSVKLHKHSSVMKSVSQQSFLQLFLFHTGVLELQKL